MISEKNRIKIAEANADIVKTIYNSIPMVSFMKNDNPEFYQRMKELNPFYMWFLRL